jgi:hypothetical protein
MAVLKIRDVYGNEFEIDASARPFWEHREGYEILPDPASEPAATAAPVEPTPPKTSAKAAVRPAPESKE